MAAATTQIIELFLYHATREDASDLFGLTSIEELFMYEKLLTVSGIGPKTALNIFSTATVNDIRSAIVNGDPAILKKVSGIGPKTAERVVLELKNKMDGVVGVNMKSGEELSADADVIEALTSLGYSAGQAREVLSQISSELKDTAMKVKEALRLLNKS
jgi:Holliday junction DNA helicase RuvA